MVVFSNHRLGPGVELIVSAGVAASILRAAAAAASPFAGARWEHELVRWLDERARELLVLERRPGVALDYFDVNDIAWTPDHFEPQRRFLIEAIVRASTTSEHPLVLDRWRRLVEAHPAESVQVGRRWNWQPTA